jgi:hypothetical protein
VTDDFGEILVDGVTFNCLQGGMHENDLMAMLQKSMHGIEGIAIGFVAGTDDDDTLFFRWAHGLMLWLHWVGFTS